MINNEFLLAVMHCLCVEHDVDDDCRKLAMKELENECRVISFPHLRPEQESKLAASSDINFSDSAQVFIHLFALCQQ